MWQKKGDDVLHIELRRWAQLLLIAPLSANSLAKIVHGLCDNLATCIVRAWDFSCPMLVSASLAEETRKHMVGGSCPDRHQWVFALVSKELGR